MTRIIAITLSKGGVGKTTTAVNVAAGLARQGKQVLAIDLDTQGQMSRVLGVTPSHDLSDFISGDASADEVITYARPNLWLIAGSRKLAKLKRDIARIDIRPELTLAQSLKKHDSAYDYIILDTAPSWDVLNVNALFYATEILIPVSMEILSIQGLAEFQQGFDLVKQHHDELEVKYILPTFYDRRVSKSDEILKQLQQHYETAVCDPIRYNVRLSEAPGYGETIFEFSPKSSGAIDYQKLVEKVLEDE